MAKTRKKKKYKVNKLRGIVVLSLLLGAGLLCFCLFAPIFNIVSVEVSGNAMVSTEEILDRTLYLEGMNIFRINKGSITENLQSLAYLDTIEIKRKLPQTVEICVTESTPELLFPYMTGFLLTDARGKVLEEISDPMGWELPMIYGVEITDETISEKITVQDKVKFDIILSCIDYMKQKAHLPNITAMDFTDITNIRITYQEGYRVNFAKFEEMDYKMKMLDVILPQVDRSKGTYIDLTTPSQVFTGKEEEKTESPEPTQEEEQDAQPEGTAQPEPTENPSSNPEETKKEDEQQ